MNTNEAIRTFWLWFRQEVGCSQFTAYIASHSQLHRHQGVYTTPTAGAGTEADAIFPENATDMSHRSAFC